MNINKIMNNAIISNGKEISNTILTCQGKCSPKKYLPKTQDSCFNTISVTIEYN